MNGGAPEQRPRVVGIGLDGATFDLLRPWFAEGRLPHLRGIYARGARAPLASVVPYLSPQAWTSFMTGMNPGKHGVWDFITHVPGTYDVQFTNAAARRAPSLWRLLSDHGRQVCVMNVPMTFPPEPVNGYLLSGMEAPGVYAPFAYPPDLYPRLKKALGGYNLHGDYWIMGSPEEYLARVRQTVADQSRAARHLYGERPWDFFFMVYGSVDRVQHHFWAQMDPTHPAHGASGSERFRDAVYGVYAQIDEEIGRLLALVPDDAIVFVMSDHGAGPYHKIVYLDRWLESQGLLAYRAGAAGRAAAPRALAFRAAEEAYLLLRRRLPRGLKDWLKSRLPGVRRQIESYMLTSAVDWRRTAAFSLGIESTRIFVNVQGRFPHGFIAAGSPEYNALLRQITDGLLALRDPDTGEPVVDRVYRADELYTGPFVDEAADLVVRWRDDLYITRRAYGADARVPPGRFIDDDLASGEVGRLMAIPQTGTHRREGVFFAQGPDVEQGLDLEAASIMDLAPTLLYLLGLPVPEEMDGRVLAALVRESVRSARPVTYGSPLAAPPVPAGAGTSDAEETIVKERLRGLGYVE